MGSLIRAGLFIDGFNLYHALHDLGQNHLKWANLWRLGEDIIPSKSQQLVTVQFCTAYFPGDSGKRIRHDAYKRALELSGVKCHWGHYANDHRECPSCSHQWIRPSEKQTDINVALSVFDAARQNTIDHAYILSADSDPQAEDVAAVQVATARVVRRCVEAGSLQSHVLLRPRVWLLRRLLR